MIKAILFLLLFTSFSGASQASRCSTISSGLAAPTVLFVNGIQTEFDKACNGLGQLKTALNSNGVDISSYNFTFFHNPTEGLVQDVNELRIQAAISSRAKSLDATASTIGYYFQLGKIYESLIQAAVDGGYGPLCRSYIEYDTNSSYYLKSTSAGLFALDSDWNDICGRVWTVTARLASKLSALAAGHGVVVVAHSQGNFYLEAAYSLLVFRGDSGLPKIRGVGIAAISYKPVSGRYVTIEQDNAIYELQVKNVSVLRNLRYSPAVATNIVCAQDFLCDAIAGHGMDPEILRQATGTLSIPKKYISAFNITPQSRAYLMHEFKEVYLSNNVVDAATGRRLPSLVCDHIAASLGELNAAALTPQFSDDFNGTSLDSSKWIVESVGGNLAAYSVAGGLLNVDVAGGSCGSCGIGDGIRFKPKVNALVGDFEYTISAQEILRSRRDGSLALSIFQLLLTGGGTQLGIYVVGDAINNSGRPGHVIYGYYVDSSGTVFPIAYALNVGEYYKLQFRIRRSKGLAYLAYKVNQDSSWTEVGVPAGFPNSAPLTPSIVVVSGDGGGTTINSTFQVRIDSVQITAPPTELLTNPANGHKYELVTCGTWDACKTTALATGGHMVTIRSQAENDWIVANILPKASSEAGIWLGLYDQTRSGNVYHPHPFVWESGDTSVYRNWYEGFPNNADGTEWCVGLWRDGAVGKLWNDVRCSYPFIAQTIIEYIPNPTPNSRTGLSVSTKEK